jgi:hypothetical protein
MSTRIWCYAALLTLALSLGASFSHVLELPNKLSLGAHEYMTVQAIYQSFGPVATILEPLTLVSLVGLAIVARQRTHLVIALVAFVVSVIVWFAAVNPMNAEFARWRGAPPDSWMAVRDRWEWGHVAVFALKLVAYLSLLWFVVVARTESAGAHGRTALVSPAAAPVT